MNRTRNIICALMLAAFSSGSGFAGESAAPAGVTPPKVLKPQTVCPVMGKPIDSASYTDIQGQRVYFCCDGCAKKLLADPDKYFKQAATDGVLFQNIQKTCPVSGETLEDKTVFSDYEGRRVYFCCKKCQGKFADNAQEYLKKLDVPATSEKPAALDPGEDDQSRHDHH
ncbi:MAG: YHS domain-containing protein [Chitinivibrionia bacterium]|nr:YHS domain-containing protein [Chitinivibrionia bacterium]